MASGVQVGSAYVSIGGDVSPLHGALKEANSAVEGWASNTQSSMRRIGEVAMGTLIGNIIPKITAGFMGMASQGFEAVASYERLGMSLQSLTAKELRQQSVVTETHVLGQRTVQLTGEQQEKLKDLGLQRDLYAAKLQEESERHRQLIAKWGEEGLAVKTHAATMAQMQNRYNETSAAMATLSAKAGGVVNITSVTSKMTLSMADAMAQAAPKAKALQAWIEKLAIQSPFKQDEIAQAFRMAQAYGFVSDSADKNVVSAKRLTQAMVDFTSATGASGDTMKRVSLALGQIQAKGKLSGQEVMQLTEAGLAVDQILARAFNKSTAEIVAMREKGLIPADKAILAITKSLEEDFGGAAKRQATSLAGLASSMSDIKEIGLRNFFTGIFTAMQPVLAGLVDTIGSEGFMARITAFGTTLGNIVTNLIAQGKLLMSAFQSGGVGGLLDALGISPEAMSSITGFIAGITSLAGVIQGALGQALTWVQTTILPALTQALQFVITNWEGFKGALIAVGAVLGGSAVLGVIMGLVSALGMLLNPVVLVIAAVGALGYAWSTNFMGIQTTVLPIINAIKDGIAAFVGSLQSGQGIFLAVGTGLNNLLAPLIGVKDAMSVSTGVMNTLQTAWATLTGYIDQVRDALNNAITAFQNVIALGGSPFEALVAGVEQFLGSFLGLGNVITVVTQVQDAWAALVAFFEPTIERLKAAVGPMIESFAPLGDKIKALWEAAKPALTLLAEIVGAVLVGAFNLFLEVIAAVMPSIGTIIGNGIDAATTFLNFFVTLVTNVVSAVKDLIAGDFSGAWSHVQTIISSAVDTVKTILGNLLTNFSLIFSAIVTALVNWVTNIDTEAGTRLAAFVANIATKIKGIPENFKTTFNGIVDFLKKLDFITIGQNMIKSLADSIVQTASTYLSEKIRAVADWIPQWVKDRLNIHSPSMVFADIGRQIIEGLALGLSDSEQVALDALSKVFENLVNIANAMSQLAGFRAMPSIVTNLNSMVDQIKEIVFILADLAGWLASGRNTWAYQSAKAGTDPLVEIANNIKAMVDGLQALGDFKPVGDITGRVDDLVAGYKVIVLKFADLAGFLGDAATGLGDAVVALGVMSVIADAFGVIFQAWSAVAKAGSLAGPANMAAMMTSIADMLTQVVTTLGGLMGGHGGLPVPDELIDFAGRLADLAGAFGTIAKAWETISKFEWTALDMPAVVTFLQTFAGQVMAALDEVSRTAPAVGENFTTFIANVKAAIGLIVDVAKAWETVSDFQANAKLDVEAVVEWLASVAGLATKAMERVQSWGSITPDAAFVTFTAAVKAAIGLIGDTAKAWETISGFEWSARLDVGAVVDWLASVAGIAVRAIERVQSWGGITPDEAFNAFTTTVKNAIGLIADVAKAWETIAGFKWNTQVDVGAVVEWLASVSGLALRAMERVQAWGGLAPNEAFTAFTTAIKNSLGALNEALKFTEALALWKSAGNVSEKMTVLTADLKIIIDQIVIAQTNMRALVTDSLLKFVANISTLASSMATVVALLQSIDDLENTGNIPLAVVRIGTVIRSILTELANIIYTINEEKGELILNFGNAIGGLMQGLKSALELAMAIPESWAPPDAFMWTSFIQWIQGVFSVWQTYVDTQYGDANGAARLTLMSQFAKALSDLMTGLKTALELAIAIPKTWTPPDAAMWTNFTLWVQGVFSVWQTYVDRQYGDATGPARLALMNTFGSALSSLMSGLKTALELALAVPKTWDLPDQTKWAEFIAWVQSVFTAFQTYVDRQYGDATGPARLALMNTFGSALSSLMSGLKTALELALAVPKTWALPDQTKWAEFIAWVQSVFTAFQTYVDSQYGDATGPARLALMNTFGSALSSLMSGLKTALELALAVPKTWALPDQTKWAEFIAWVQSVFTAFQTYVDSQYGDATGPARLALMNTFGSALSSLMSGLKTALDVALAIPKTWAAPNATLWSNFTTWVQSVFTTFQTYVDTNYKDETGPVRLALVGSFATALSSLMTALKTALDLALALPKTWAPIPTGPTSPYAYLKAFVEKVFTDFQTYVTNNFPANSDAAKNLPVVVAFAGALNNVMQALGTALDVFKNLQGYIPLLDTRIDDFIASIKYAYGLIQTYATGAGVQQGTAATTAFANATSAVFTALKTALDFAKTLSDSTNPLAPTEAFKTSMQALVSRITIVLNAWKTYVETEANTVWGPDAAAFKAKIDAVFATLKTALDLFVNLNTAGMPSPTQISNFLTAVLNLFKNFVTGIQGVPGDVDDVGADTGSALNKWPANWAQYTIAYKDFGANLALQLATGFAQAMAPGSSMWLWVQPQLNAAINSMGTYAGTTTGNPLFRTAGGALAGKLVEGFKAALDAIAIAGGNDLMSAGIRTVVTYLSNWFVTAFQDLGKSFAGNLALGWKAGMEAQAAAGSFMTNSTYIVTNAIKAAIKAAFGITSPSKVTTGYGLQIAAGLGKGMLGGLPDVEAATRALYQAAQPAFGNMGGEWDVNSRKVITVRFEGQAGGGVPLTPVQFSRLKAELAYALVIGA